VGVALLVRLWACKQFFSKSLKIYKTYINIKNITIIFKSVGVAVLGGLWA